MIFKKVGMISVLVVLVVLLMSFLASAGTGEEPVKKGNIRVVAVKVAADQEYREFYGAGWQEQARNLVEKVSQAFEIEVGIRFEPQEFEEWDSEVHEDIVDFIEELRKEVKLGDNDLVIGFTGKGNWGGLAAIERAFGNYVFITDSKAARGWWKKVYEANKEYYQTQPGWETWEKWQKRFSSSWDEIILVRLLASTLGKIFGAMPIDNEKDISIMNEHFLYKKISSLVFDKENKKVILANKDIDFRQLAEDRNRAEEELKLVERCKLKIKTIELSQKEEEKIWLEMVSHLDKAAELYERIPSNLKDLMDASDVRAEALVILKALGAEEEYKQESLALAEVYVKTAQFFERACQVGAADISLENIALSYYAAANWFIEAGENRNAAEYGLKAAEYYEQAGGIKNLSFAKKLYEWAAQGFEYLGEKEKAKEALEKAKSVELRIQEKRI